MGRLSSWIGDRYVSGSSKSEAIQADLTLIAREILIAMRQKGQKALRYVGLGRRVWAGMWNGNIPEDKLDEYSALTMLELEPEEAQTFDFVKAQVETARLSSY